MLFKNENSLTSIKDRWSKPPYFIIRNIDDIILCIGFFLEKKKVLYIGFCLRVCLDEECNVLREFKYFEVNSIVWIII